MQQSRRQGPAGLPRHETPRPRRLPAGTGADPEAGNQPLTWQFGRPAAMAMLT